MSKTYTYNDIQTLIAILFASGAPVLLKEIAPEVIGSAQEKLAGTGLVLVVSEKSVELRTAPEQSELIARQRRKELEKDIGKAGLEVLAIVLYKEGATRSSIDYIRGVNSSGTLRTLVMRGLVERTKSTGTTRSILYRPSVALLAHLGIRSVNDLKDYQHVCEKFAALERGREEEEESQEV